MDAGERGEPPFPKKRCSGMGGGRWVEGGMENLCHFVRNGTWWGQKAKTMGGRENLCCFVINGTGG